MPRDTISVPNPYFGSMILDCFLWAGPGERNLLLAKLNIEKNIVDQFFIADCAYSFKGTYKGLTLKNIIQKDPVFHEFIPKISIIETPDNPIKDFIEVYRGEVKVKYSIKNELRHGVTMLIKRMSFQNLDEFKVFQREELARRDNRIFRIVENTQRESLRERLLECAKEDDYIFISDIDEILDGDTPDCAQIIGDYIIDRKSPTMLHLQKRLRIWDFDNLNFSRQMTNPLVRASLVAASPYSLNTLRRMTSGYYVKHSKELVHEYSSCQPYEELLKKYAWYPDLNSNTQDLDDAFNYNCELVQDGKYRGWCEPVDPELDHQPNWIRENIGWLKTRNVNANFWNKRREVFPDLFPT